MINIVFYIFGFFAILGSLGAIISKHPLNSAMSLLVTLISIAVIYALLGAKFLFAIQLIIYAGAVMVLVVFVVMYLNIKDMDLDFENNRFKYMLLGLFVASPLVVIFLLSIYEYSFYEVFHEQNPFNVQNIAHALFIDWAFPFEIISVVLLSSIIGAIMVIKHKG